MRLGLAGVPDSVLRPAIAAAWLLIAGCAPSDQPTVETPDQSAGGAPGSNVGPANTSADGTPPPDAPGTGQQEATRSQLLSTPDLTPKIPAFTEQAAGMAGPGAAKMAELRDLMQTAFKPGYADKRTATKAMGALLEDPEAFWALEEGLQDEDVAVANLCAFHLGTVGVQASILPLLKRLKYEQDDPNLYWVRHALYRLGNYAGCRKLADNLDASGFDALHSNALRDLAIHWDRHGRPLAPAAKGGQPTEPLTAARIAARMLDLVKKPLRPIDDCRFILGRAGHLSLPVLREALHGEERYLRTHVLEIVATLGPVARELSDDVVALVGARDSAAYAVRALGKIADRSVWPTLEAVLQRPVRKASDYELQKAAMVAAARIGEDKVRPYAARALADEAQPPDLRVAAAFVEGSFGDPAGVRFLQTTLAAGSYHAPTLRELLDELDEPYEAAGEGG